MPTLLPDPCTEIGCHNPRLPKSSKCVEHHKTKPRSTKAWYHTWYREKAWKQMRAEQLFKEPLCQCCLLSGKVVEAKHVDHTVPHKGSRSVFMDKKNLQSLCVSCHSVKTTLERKGHNADYTSASVRLVTKILPNGTEACAVLNNEQSQVGRGGQSQKQENKYE